MPVRQNIKLRHGIPKIICHLHISSNDHILYAYVSIRMLQFGFQYYSRVPLPLRPSSSSTHRTEPDPHSCHASVFLMIIVIASRMFVGTIFSINSINFHLSLSDRAVGQPYITYVFAVAEYMWKDVFLWWVPLQISGPGRIRQNR